MMNASTPPQNLQHIPSVPYVDNPSKLQTLDLWLPRPLQESDPRSTTWIVYVHGGAWRDPTQDSRCVVPTLNHLPSTTLSSIAAIASINYRLSPYTTHPTLPSSPADPDRNALHPQHIRDVAAAIHFLRVQYGMQRWVGAGHSCGATLLAQLVSKIGLAGDDDVEDVGNGPEALMLLEGIYDIPRMLRNHEPPACPANIAQIYVEFVEGAFGPDRDIQGGGGRTWFQSVSPAFGSFVRGMWPAGKLAVIAYSPEDELIEGEQGDAMLSRFKEEGWVEGGEGDRVVESKALKGGHDWIWEDGVQIANLIAEVVKRIV
ncbi:alpha/beta-hydrolase [Corynespora cassiicola Philippines]|uniref:Kynurenine formamidase n=1 Tax=Corynespora cassiicola Philippines TaxID=1448308 RepID=A0A2T2N2S3_CORCC|nr:alpha/beta-hydrolase [Corynespora cassiicola Philippines]